MADLRAEIERLRDADQLREAAFQCYVDIAQQDRAEITRLKAEIERLRAVEISAKQPESNMTDFTVYRRKQTAELRPYRAGESMDGVSISGPDKEAGSPKPGDMIARNPKNHADKWLVAAQYFADNFEPEKK